MAIKSTTRQIMQDRFCKKCNHLCHCVEADAKGCDCENCECMQREEDKTYEKNIFSISITICIKRLLGRPKMCCYR